MLYTGKYANTPKKKPVASVSTWLKRNIPQAITECLSHEKKITSVIIDKYY